MKINKKGLMTLSFLQIASYFLLIESISVLRSTSFDSVVIDISGNFFLRTLNILALIIGIPIIYFAPGLLWIAKKKDCTLWELIIKSALLSVVLYTVAFSILKFVFAIELSRSWMLLTCSGITVTWAILDKRQFEISYSREEIRSVLIGGLTIIFLIVLFHGKIFLENFTGDGTEAFEFSRSLKTKILPYWDLENGRWGFYPRFMFFAYPNILSILHLGEIEASVRLPFFIFLFCIHLLMVALIQHESGRSKASASDSLFVSGAILLFVIFNIFYSTWHPYFADIAEPTHVDTMVVFYFLAAILFLLNEQQEWFLLCCLLTCLSVANGVALTFFLFSTFFLLGRNRKRIFYLGLSFTVVYLAYLGSVAIYDKFHPLGFQRWSLEGMREYFSWDDLLSPDRYFLHLKYLLLMTGVIPVLFFPFMRKSDDLAIKIYLISALYISGIFLFDRYNPHYFTSVALLFFIPFLRTVNGMERKNAQYAKLSYAVVVGIIILLIFPFRYTLNQTARELGSHTCIEATDYQAQVALAEVVHRVFPFRRYGVGHHTLVYYAAKGQCPENNHNYIFTTRDPSEKFIQIDDIDVLMRKGVRKPDHPRKRYEGNYRSVLREIYWRNRRGD